MASDWRLEILADMKQTLIAGLRNASQEDLREFQREFDELPEASRRSSYDLPRLLLKWIERLDLENKHEYWYVAPSPEDEVKLLTDQERHALLEALQPVIQRALQTISEEDRRELQRDLAEVLQTARRYAMGPLHPDDMGAPEEYLAAMEEKRLRRVYEEETILAYRKWIQRLGLKEAN